MLLKKVFLLIWCLYKKIIFRTTKLIFGLKNWLWTLIMPIFGGPQLIDLTRYQKILLGCLFGCKNLLNFTRKTMKFHNCLHANVDASKGIPSSRWKCRHLPCPFSNTNSKKLKSINLTEVNITCTLQIFTAVIKSFFIVHTMHLL